MERILLLLSFYVFTLSLSASTIEADEGQQWYGYYTGSEQLSEFGTGQAENYMCAAFFPGDKGQAFGKTIRAVRFVIQGVTDVSNMRVWISTSLPGTLDDVDVEVKEVDMESVSDLIPYDVALDDPYAVTAKGVYVGYCFDSDDPFPVMATTGVPTLSNSFYLKTSESYPTWQDLTKFNYGNLAVQVLLDGEFHENAAKVEKFEEVVTTTGQQVSLPLTIVNWGNLGMSSIDYVLTSDGVAQAEQHYDFAEPVMSIRGKTTILLPFISPDQASISHKTVTITRVNGVPNEYSASEATGHGALIAIEESAPRRVVMEEFTGTWCGWCPRGMVGLEHLEKDYGDNFIGIAVHNNDPMAIPDYDELLPSGYPSERLDRQESGDPFFGSTYGLGSEPSYGISADVSRHLDELTEASVQLQADWEDADSTRIKATTEVSLQYDRDDNPPYALAYVLLADSLRGTGHDWTQNNDFCLIMAQGYATDPYLGFLTSLDQRIKNMTYNDVAVATAGLRRGLTGSVVGPFVKNVPNVTEYTMDINGNTVIQNKRYLRLAVLLLNTETGRIVNAADVAVGNGQTSAVRIPTTLSDYNDGVCYSIDGKRLQTPQHGINIIRRADGSVTKLMVR